MSTRIDCDQHHIDMDDVTDFVHKTTGLEIRDLSTDVLVLILSLLHGRDIARCINVCRYFAEVVRSDLYLQYKIELAQNGMVDGDYSALCVSERLGRLRECSSRFRNGTFDYEDLAAHLRHTHHQMRKVRWNTTISDERSLSILHGFNVNFPTFRHGQLQDGPFDLFLTIFTPGAALAGIPSSRSMLRIGTADEYGAIMTKWAVDGQDLLVVTDIADIALPEHLQPRPDEFNIHFYSLGGSKTAGRPTPHPDAAQPSVRVSAPARTYDTQPFVYIDEVHISGQHVIWALAVTSDDDEIRSVIAVFVGVCNWRTGQLISLIDFGAHLVHAVPLDYPYLLLIPKAFQIYPHLTIYDVSKSDIPSRRICTLLVPDEESGPGDGTMPPWYQVHTGNRPQTSHGHFHADLSQSVVVLSFYYVYAEDNSERGNHYLIPRATFLAQIRAAESRQTQTQLQTHSDGAPGGPAVTLPAVPWADWGPQGCLRLSLRCRQAHRADPMPFGSRFPLFVVDKEDPGKASVYVFDVNPLVARHERQLLTTRHHPNPSNSNAMSGDPAKGVTGMVVEDIEAVLPGLVDPDCSRIPYIAYRFQLPDVLMEWREGQFIGRAAMGMTGFTIKMVGGEYEKAEQTWTV